MPYQAWSSIEYWSIDLYIFRSEAAFVGSAVGQMKNVNLDSVEITGKMH